MHVLVTGGSGFIGANIINFLSEKGCTVVNYDLQVSDYHTRKLWKNKIDEVNGEINDIKLLSSTIKKFNIEAVVHSAAINGEINARKNINKTFTVNTKGTVDLLLTLQELGIKKLIFIGSGTQYGVGEITQPLTEEMECKPQGIYATTKQMAEMFGIRTSALLDIDFISLRISAPYGPLQRVKFTPMHIGYWCQAALKGENIKLESGGDHCRDFTYVEDISAITYELLKKEIPINIINFSSGKLITLKEVMQTIQKLIPNTNFEVGKGLLEFKTNPQIETSIRGPLDVSKAKKYLNFESQFGLEEGIRKYVYWLKDNKHK